MHIYEALPAIEDCVTARVKRVTNCAVCFKPLSGVRATAAHGSAVRDRSENPDLSVTTACCLQ